MLQTKIVTWLPLAAVMALALVSATALQTSIPSPTRLTPAEACTASCEADRDSCMADAAHGGPRPAVCAAAFRACLRACP